MWKVMQNDKIIFGENAIEKNAIEELLNAKNNVYVLTYDKNAAATKAIISSLKDQGISYIIDDSVQSEPDIEVIEVAAKQAKEFGSDVIIALGGGSVLDAAKAIAMLVVNGGELEDYQIRNKPITKDALQIIAIPTTSGTGSEASNVSVVYNKKLQLKKSIYSPSMIPKIVILDPAVTVGLPYAITASTGIDALSHAIESYVSLNATPYTEMYSMQSLKLVIQHLENCLTEPGDLEARGGMLLASYFGGCALNAGIGLAHMIAQPIGGLFGIPHGDACSIFLPYAMEYNINHSLNKYCDIARCFGIAFIEPSKEVAYQGIQAVKDLIKRVGTPTHMKAFVPENFDLDKTIDIVTDATSHIVCNPRPVDRATLEMVLKQVI